jgi:NADPH:quinone reductase-like Zn-dependent oxidoreductase
MTKSAWIPKKNKSWHVAERSFRCLSSFTHFQNGSPRPVVGLELSLKEAARARREIMESSHYGRIVLIP